jgi:hypothetical protein
VHLKNGNGDEGGESTSNAGSHSSDSEESLSSNYDKPVDSGATNGGLAEDHYALDDDIGYPVGSLGTLDRPATTPDEVGEGSGNGEGSSDRADAKKRKTVWLEEVEDEDDEAGTVWVEDFPGAGAHFGEGDTKFHNVRAAQQMAGEPPCNPFLDLAE